MKVLSSVMRHPVGLGYLSSAKIACVVKYIRKVKICRFRNMNYKQSGKQFSFPEEDLRTRQDLVRPPAMRYVNTMIETARYFIPTLFRTQVKRRLSLQVAVKSFKNKLGSSSSSSRSSSTHR